MKVLVLNSGSSSIKFQLFNMEEERVLAKGLVERIGIEDSAIEYENNNGQEVEKDIDIANHRDGIEHVIEMLLDSEVGVLEDIDEINAVGHRVVHGGEKFAHSTLITDEVIEKTGRKFFSYVRTYSGFTATDLRPYRLWEIAEPPGWTFRPL